MSANNITSSEENMYLPPAKEENCVVRFLKWLFCCFLCSDDAVKEDPSAQKTRDLSQKKWTGVPQQNPGSQTMAKKKVVKQTNSTPVHNANSTKKTSLNRGTSDPNYGPGAVRINLNPPLRKGNSDPGPSRSSSSKQNGLVSVTDKGVVSDKKLGNVSVANQALVNALTEIKVTKTKIAGSDNDEEIGFQFLGVQYYFTRSEYSNARKPLCDVYTKSITGNKNPSGMILKRLVTPFVNGAMQGQPVVKIDGEAMNLLKQAFKK